MGEREIEKEKVIGKERGSKRKEKRGEERERGIGKKVEEGKREK